MEKACLVHLAQELTRRGSGSKWNIKKITAGAPKKGIVTSSKTTIKGSFNQLQKCRVYKRTERAFRIIFHVCQCPCCLQVVSDTKSYKFPVPRANQRKNVITTSTSIPAPCSNKQTLRTCQQYQTIPKSPAEAQQRTVW